MIKLKKNISLKPYNTFGIEVFTDFFIQLDKAEDISTFIKNYDDIPKPIYFIGLGANTLFTKDFSGTVVHINTKGIQKYKETTDSIYLRVQAGEIWDDFIDFCITNNFSGIENLAAIPSTIGAAPIQNIGAYGVEVKDSIEYVKYIDLNNFNTITLNNKECQFSYRNSLFKTPIKNQFLVTEVGFKLSKTLQPILEYGSIKERLNSLGITNPDIKQIADTIRQIRADKLPDYKILGNAGSFFKNPIIPIDNFNKLKDQFPNIIAYPQNNNTIKIAAAWLIDKAGLASYQIGGAAIHENQALVIINKNQAQAKDIINLCSHIQTKIKLLFNIELLPEVIFV